MQVHSAFWCLFHFFRNRRFGRIRLKSGSNSDLIQDIQGVITSRKIKLGVAEPYSKIILMVWILKN